MAPKIPQLKRENASLRNPKDQQKVQQDPPKAGSTRVQTTQPPEPKKVWWNDSQEDSGHDVNKEARHDVGIYEHNSREPFRLHFVQHVRGATQAPTDVRNPMDCDMEG